jgi:hypothetical protein
LVENIHTDKYETNNYIGSMGIKELKGRLNIGANYTDSGGSEEVKEKILEKVEEKLDEKKAERLPKLNIKTKENKDV